MKFHKRALSIVLLVSMVWGLLPPLPIHAEENKDYLTTPYHIDSTDWNGQLKTENIDNYINSISNLNFESNLASVDVHAADYADRFLGLAALCLNDIDVVNDTSDGGTNPYTAVIAMAKESGNFSEYYAKASISIGGNPVATNIYDDPDLALFLFGNQFAELLDADTEASDFDNESMLDKYQAMTYTAIEYMYYADEWRKSVNTYMETHNGVMRASDAQLLDDLHRVFMFAGNNNYNEDGSKTGETNPEPFSFIVNLWLAAGNDQEKGLSELWEISKDTSRIYTDSAYGDLTLEHEQPLVNFYRVNNESGITYVDTNALTTSSGVSAGKTVSEDVTFSDAADNVVDNVVAATERSYVTIGESIMKGTAYSAGYIPMQTNLYSTATVNGYDTTWLTDWHYKYGFMRKALYKDKSSTSAMDYYNSLGVNKGDLEVCTLRDFLELGEKDLTLYIDDSFYNASEAESTWLNIIDEDTVNLDEFIEDLDTFLKQSYGSDETQIDYLRMDAQFINDTYDYDLSSTTEEDVNELLSSLKRQRRASSAAIEFDSIVKTGKYNQYSTKVRQTIIDTGVGEFIANAVSGFLGLDNYDSVVMASSDISDTLDCITVRTEAGGDETMIDYEYTTYDEYTPMLSFAYVSAIYRDKAAFKVSTLNELGTPVFIASDDVAQVKDATLYDRSSLLNYMLVRNLNSMVQINYTYSMDMDSPVYMDIYGNIITESGLVIIPAACNATLYPDDYCNYMYAIGLFSCYGNDYYVPGDYEYVEDVLSGFFTLDEENNVWLIDGKGVQVDNVKVDFANIKAYVYTTQEAMFDAFTEYLYSEDVTGDHSVTHVIWPKWIEIINEVMRGAPLEHIDKDAENLRTDGLINKTAIVAAAKLEALIGSLESAMSNTLLNIPDFTTMEHSEYVVAFAFKLLIVAVVVIVIVQIYQDAAAGILGLRTLLKSAYAVGLTFLGVAVIPAVFQLTYYTANKLLLQDEVAKICMYNLEKSQSGIEIGVTSTDVPDTHNKIMVQLDWIDVPWYEEINQLLFGESLGAVDIARETAKQSSIVANAPDVQFYNDGVYMDVEEIFNSVGMDYTFNVGELAESKVDVDLNGDINEVLSELENPVDSATSSDKGVDNGLYLYSNGSNQTLSFYSPYYAFLTALTANVNYYNESHNCYMYTTKLQSGNRLKTVGLCSQYFQSESFMELDSDLLHLYEIYGIPKETWYDVGSVFYSDEVDRMHMSTWYNDIVAANPDEARKRIEIVNGYARDFVADNRELLDKVTDETFIKVMALTLAMKYNQVFGITEASCFEIYNLDSNDLLRLSIAETNDAMLTSPMSYARFVLSLGGESSVYAAAILVMIMFIGSFIKPLCVLIAFISVFMSIFVFKVLLRKKSRSLLGYIVTVLLLSVTNFLHAVILKVSTYLPSIGLSMLGCLIAIIVFQISYLVVLSYVTAVALKDWQNLGADKYQETAESVKYKFSKKDSNHLSANIPRHDNNWDYYDELVSQHRERNNNL